MLFTLMLSVVLFSGCSKVKDEKTAGEGSKKKQSFKFENSKENLHKLFKEIQSASQTGKYKKGASLTRSIFPTEKEIKSVLKESVSEGDLKAIVEMNLGFTPDKALPDETVAKAFVNDPKKTEIQVHAATTEELISYAKGSAAYNEFPGGARRLAISYFKPGVTFYEVEFLEPGNTRGMKYHLFFWNGSSWSMFGPAWRVIK